MKQTFLTRESHLSWIWSWICPLCSWMIQTVTIFSLEQGGVLNLWPAKPSYLGCRAPHEVGSLAGGEQWPLTWSSSPQQIPQTQAPHFQLHAGHPPMGQGWGWGQATPPFPTKLGYTPSPLPHGASLGQATPTSLLQGQTMPLFPVRLHSGWATPFHPARPSHSPFSPHEARLQLPPNPSLHGHHAGPSSGSRPPAGSSPQTDMALPFWPTGGDGEG